METRVGDFDGRVGWRRSWTRRLPSSTGVALGARKDGMGVDGSGSSKGGALALASFTAADVGIDLIWPQSPVSGTLSSSLDREVCAMLLPPTFGRDQDSAAILGRERMTHHAPCCCRPFMDATACVRALPASCGLPPSILPSLRATRMGRLAMMHMAPSCFTGHPITLGLPCIVVLQG